MKKLRLLLLALPALLPAQPAAAQQVPCKTVVEHFTNTYCSICASRNPGFYSNLSAFPDVLHISYYPSAPYAACPFNQMNKPENDARTNFYGIYGSTPRLVINGIVVPGGTLYTDPAIFRDASGQTSDFSLDVRVRRTSPTMGEATITIKKVAANTLGSLYLYAVVAEDTVQFNANNGETTHYDLFHQSLTGAAPLMLGSPMAVGDSVSRTFSFATGSGWSPARVTAILQDDMKNGLQAARSAMIPSATSVPPMPYATPLCMYPVPAKGELHFTALPAGYHNYTITNNMGQLVQRGIVYDAAKPIPLQSLMSGFYIITMDAGGQLQRGTFVKE